MRQYQLGIYEKGMPNELSLEEKLFKAKEFGFDWIELSIDESDEKIARLYWSNDQITKIKNAMCESNMQFRTMALSEQRKFPMGTLDKNIEAKSMEMIFLAIDLCSKLGIHIIQVPGYDVFYEESNNQTKENFQRNIKKATRAAAGKGIILAFETMTTDFMNTTEKAMHVVEKINSPFLQIYPDVANLVYQLDGTGRSVADDLKCGIGHIVAAHIKETNKEHQRRIPFGSGNDYTQYFVNCSVLKELGCRMFTAEFWHKQDEDYEQMCKFANTC